MPRAWIDGLDSGSDSAQAAARREAYLAEHDLHGLPNSMLGFPEFYETRKTRMRERLEPLTLIDSLDHITDAQIDRIEGIQREIELNTDVSRFLVLDREFHMTSYAACPSEMLLATTLRLWNSTQHYRRAFMLLAGNDRAAVVNAEHRLLLDAISRRDPEDSERFLVGHIRRTRVALTSHPEVFASD